MLMACKFTPLGFETRLALSQKGKIHSVNLPRWGLKLELPKFDNKRYLCKFTPLGFETSSAASSSV